MDECEIRKLVQKHSFIENNGMILRMLNLLNAKERKIGSIQYIMHEVSLDDLRNSFHYLHDSGYIRIQHPDGAACIGTDKESYSHTKIDITHQGMNLLMGIQDNPAVDI